MKLINYLGKIDPTWAQKIDEDELRTFLYLLASIPFMSIVVIEVCGFVFKFGMGWYTGF